MVVFHSLPLGGFGLFAGGRHIGGKSHKVTSGIAELLHGLEISLPVFPGRHVVVVLKKNDIDCTFGPDEPHLTTTVVALRKKMIQYRCSQLKYIIFYMLFSSPISLTFVPPCNLTTSMAALKVSRRLIKARCYCEYSLQSFKLAGYECKASK
jgi:hypothetical protein